MTQIPVLNGTYTDADADFRSSYPVNLIPVPKDNGISKGYLRPLEGLISAGSGPGVGRGGINWNGALYRVMGTKLVQINAAGAFTVLGEIPGSGQVSFAYSVDRLAIAASNHLYYYKNGVLSVVTDIDLGTVLDVIWIDGYFMTTDGINLVVTELNDPTSVNPLKYGSAEADPDPIVGLTKIQNEVYAVGRYSVEVFDNVGGDNFPFQRMEGAMIQKGALGTHCFCEINETLAFLGSGKKESPAIYLGKNATTNKISTREVDQILSLFTEDQLSKCVLEKRVDKGHIHLWVHLPDRTLVFDAAGSQVVGQPIWYVMTSSLAGFSTYRARNLVWAFDQWNCEDPTTTTFGYLESGLSSQYGQLARWEFGTTIVYADSASAIFHQLELVCLTGRIELGLDPTISTSYSVDGENWSQEKFVRVGKSGDTTKRIVWFQQGHMRSWRVQRFKGTSAAHISIARLEALIEPLAH